MQAQLKRVCMDFTYTEQRHQPRRSLKMPVTFFLKGKKGSISDYFFGWTKDVSLNGACICTKPNYIPIVDSLMILLVTPEAHNRFSESDISVKIKGKVTWNNSDTQSFGVRFI